MTPQLEAILRSVDRLSPPEQLAVICHIAEHLQQRNSQLSQSKWLDLAGTVPYPLFGEDAQVWVSRCRSDAQAQRDLYG